MRRYYFDLRDGDVLISDKEGIELATLEAVKDEAARALIAIAKDDLQGSKRIKAATSRLGNRSSR